MLPPESMVTSGPGVLLRGMSGSVVVLPKGSVLISKGGLTTKGRRVALGLCCHKRHVDV